MKIIITILFVSVLQIIKLLFLWSKGLLFILYLLFSYSWHYTNKIQRILYVKEYRSRTKPKFKRRSDKTPVFKPVAENKSNIVGQTKTEFITEAPKMREIEPFKSEPLEKVIEPADYEEEPDIDPDDYIDQSELAIREEVEFEQAEADRLSHEANFSSEEISSGVSMEQLQETYNTLKKLNPTDKEEEEAAAVLYNIVGTTIYDFYMTHQECTDNAKLIMDRQKSKSELHVMSENQNKFDIEKYI